MVVLSYIRLIFHFSPFLLLELMFAFRFFFFFYYRFSLPSPASFAAKKVRPGGRASLAVGPGLKILRDRPKARKMRTQQVLWELNGGKHFIVHF